MVNSVGKILLLAIVFGFISMTTASACGGNGYDPNKPCEYEITIRGNITDSNGNALSGIYVRIEKYDNGAWNELGFDTTDGAGHYKIDKEGIVEKNDEYRMYLNGNLVANRLIEGNMWDCEESDSDNDGNILCTCEEWEYTWDQISIPEFSTIAMPIASVIGLVFFFQRKKKKESQ